MSLWPFGRDAHHHLGAVGREARREAHAGEVAQKLAAAAVDVLQVDARRAAVLGVRHVDDLLQRRREARRQRDGAAVGDVAVVGAVLVHDGDALDARVERAGLGDIGDAGVEVALLAGHALVDRVGDDVGEPPPVGGLAGEGEPGRLLADHDVPQAEVDLDVAAGLLDLADHDAGRADAAPVGEARRGVGVDVLLDEGAGRDRAEQAGVLQVVADHAGDVGADAIAGEIDDGDRHRLEARPGHVDGELRARRRRRTPAASAAPPRIVERRGSIMSNLVFIEGVSL